MLASKQAILLNTYFRTIPHARREVRMVFFRIATVIKNITHMVITRKIEVFICESDKDLRRSYYDKLYDIRNIAQKAANAATSHLFMLDNKIPYLDEASREAIQFVGTKGTPASRQNAAYCVMSNLFKESMPGIMDMLSNLAQYVTKNYNEDRKKGMYKRSLRSYRDTLPIPYQRKSFKELRFEWYEDIDGDAHEGCFFSLAGIPFQMRFGRDRSGNRLIVERVISGEYKMCTSSIQINGNKCFLLLCVDIPKKEVKLDEDKTLFAFLGVLNPIICTCDVRAAKEYDSGYKWFEIGTKEEFHYRRRQIQEAVRRCQINNRYSIGGKGRKKKCKAIERYHDKEKNYIDTKLHTYSRMLVDLAIKHRCGKIVLMRETHREEDAKRQNKEGDALVLRNWSYYGLKEKIAYKCKMSGITMIEEK
jgi:transposase